MTEGKGSWAHNHFVRFCEVLVSVKLTMFAQFENVTADCYLLPDFTGKSAASNSTIPISVLIKTLVER